MELMLAEAHTKGTELVEGGCADDSLHLKGSTDWSSHERILVITEGVLGYSIDGLSVFHMLDCYYGFCCWNGQELLCYRPMNEVDAIDQSQKRHQLNLCTGDCGTGNHHTNQVDAIEGGHKSGDKGE